MPHKRNAKSRRRRAEERTDKRNMFASLMENCFGTEAGRNITTGGHDNGYGLVPVGLIELDLLKPERVHGGMVRYDVTTDKRGNIHINGHVTDGEPVVTKAVNKRAARLAHQLLGRHNWKPNRRRV